MSFGSSVPAIVIVIECVGDILSQLFLNFLIKSEHSLFPFSFYFPVLNIAYVDERSL